MIRINLLPFRTARRIEDARKQVSIFLLSIILLLTLMGLVWIITDSRVNRLAAERDRKQAELKTYEPTTKKIAELKQKIKAIEAKLDVIRKLEQAKSGPVQLLDEIAQAVPKDRLWLNALAEKGGTVSLSGTALNNDTVAEFMTNLEGMTKIAVVDLQSARLKPSANLDLSDFSLVCRPETPPAPEKSKPQRRKR